MVFITRDSFGKYKAFSNSWDIKPTLRNGRWHRTPMCCEKTNLVDNTWREWITKVVSYHLGRELDDNEIIEIDVSSVDELIYWFEQFNRG